MKISLEKQNRAEKFLRFRTRILLLRPKHGLIYLQGSIHACYIRISRGNKNPAGGRLNRDLSGTAPRNSIGIAKRPRDQNRISHRAKRFFFIGARCPESGRAPFQWALFFSLSLRITMNFSLSFSFYIFLFSFSSLFSFSFLFFFLFDRCRGPSDPCRHSSALACIHACSLHTSK